MSDDTRHNPLRRLSASEREETFKSCLADAVNEYHAAGGVGPDTMSNLLACAATVIVRTTTQKARAVAVMHSIAIATQVFLDVLDVKDE